MDLKIVYNKTNIFFGNMNEWISHIIICVEAFEGLLLFLKILFYMVGPGQSIKCYSKKRECSTLIILSLIVSLSGNISC